MSTGNAQADSPPEPPARSRQEPGSACEACRRRKLRCDRKQPRCGLCVDSGEECIVITSRKRGPKRGHMKTLLARLSAVEDRLTSAPNSNEASNPTEGNSEPMDISQTDPPVDHPSTQSFSQWLWQDGDFGQANDAGDVPSSSADGNPHDPQALVDINQNMPSGGSPGPDMQFNLFPNMLSGPGPMDPAFVPSLSPPIVPSDISPFMPTADMLQTGMGSHNALMPDLHHSDRDQLYFDRVHDCMPIIHEQNYYSWSTSPNKTSQQVCLQQIMWALAISASAQPLAVANALYHGARQRLEEMEAQGEGHELLDVQQAQAWLLIAIFEFVRVNFRRGWMSAGRAFRRILLMRLHEIDRADSPVVMSSAMDWAHKEERRRTFWLAYSLDRFVSLSNGSPATLSEEADVRMPAPEANFLSGQSIATNFLSDAVLNRDGPDNSLTEFVIVATACGWAHSHRQLSLAKRTLHNPMQAFWERHRRIDKVLAPRMTSMPAAHPNMMRQAGPLPLLTHVMVQTMTIYVYKTMIDCFSYQDESHQPMVDEYARSFRTAVVEMSNVSTTLSQMSCFKAHPFCPIALYICIDCLRAFNESGGGFSEQLRVASSALDNLRRINQLGEEFKSHTAEMQMLALPAPHNMEALVT